MASFQRMLLYKCENVNSESYWLLGEGRGSGVRQGGDIIYRHNSRFKKYLFYCISPLIFTSLSLYSLSFDFIEAFSNLKRLFFTFKNRFFRMLFKYFPQYFRFYNLSFPFLDIHESFLKNFPKQNYCL